DVNRTPSRNSFAADDAEDLIVDWARGGEAAAFVDGLDAAQIGKAPAGLPDEDGGSTDVVALHARVDHRIDAAKEQLAVSIEVCISARRERVVGEAFEDAEVAPFGELLEAAVRDGGMLELFDLRDAERATVAIGAVAERCGIEVIV